MVSAIYRFEINSILLYTVDRPIDLFIRAIARPIHACIVTLLSQLTEHAPHD